VQALIDTRVQIEKWTNQPVDFHFATILSPWIRRSLVAAGFGYDLKSQALARPHDVATVDPPYDILQSGPSSKDVEVGDTKEIVAADRSYGSIQSGEVSVVQVDTPFFHLDLAEAVAAAEAGLLRVPSQSSHRKSGSNDDDALGTDWESGK
jgi:sodium-independent sulfate anion transporter 11